MIDRDAAVSVPVRSRSLSPPATLPSTVIYNLGTSGTWLAPLEKVGRIAAGPDDREHGGAYRCSPPLGGADDGGDRPLFPVRIADSRSPESD